MGFNMGLKYRRIDPNYRSLGAYFFDNDIEDYTATAAWSMLNNRLFVSAVAGLQQDNLDNLKPNTMTRFIGSVNAHYTLDQFSAGLHYSNYTSDIEYVLDPELDSLSVVIATQDLGANASYSISDANENRHVITFAANIQEVVDDIDAPQTSAQSSMLNLNLVYALLLKEGNWNTTTNLNYNQSQLSMVDVNRWGMGAGISKPLMENKLIMGLNFNYYNASVETQNNIKNSTFNAHLRCNYRFSKNHAFKLNYVLLNRKKTDDTGLENLFSEGIGNFGYQYNFGWKPRQN